MKITRTRNVGVISLGNVAYGNIVIFHSYPTRVAKQNGFARNAIELGVPYVLADWARGSAAMLIRCDNGAPARANYSDYVEEFDNAELML